VTLDGTKVAIDGPKTAQRVKPNLNFSVSGKSALAYLTLAFPDSSGGNTYDCASASTSVAIVVDGVVYASDPNVREQCGIRVDEVGPVGGRVRGAFEAYLVPARSPSGRVRRVVGTFDVVRSADTQ
jgi:hypothetical protein